ncbi:MAG: DUF2828 family protein [Eubacteriales bacterium]|nr:DUF2828 family protein [Eubacteriales bacterium]
MNGKELLMEEANRTKTMNHAEAYRSTLDACLNLFASAGGMRHTNPRFLYREYFIPAYIENPDLAMKLLFHIRDIQMGMGEREIFRGIVRQLAVDFPKSVAKNIPYFGEYGRFDDLFSLMGTPCEKELIPFIKRQLEEDEQKLEQSGEQARISLLAKWMPSVSTSSRKTRILARKLASLLDLSEKQYRKRLSALRSQIALVETKLSQGGEIAYDKVPAKAMLKYRSALSKRESFATYLEEVRDGKAKMNTAPVFPYEIIRPLMKARPRWWEELGHEVEENERLFLDTMWKAKKEDFECQNALVIADGSGSMYGPERDGVTPALLAQSLAMFYAERNQGIFHNCFITFSRHPQLIEIKGRDLMEKLLYVQSFDAPENTDLLAVFRLILNMAVRNQLDQSELPSTLYIVSDMEFDECTGYAGDTPFETAKKEYEDAGYKLPAVVFRNVNRWQKQFPVKKNTKGAAMTSGSQTASFHQKVTRETTPYDFMLQVLLDERYRPICA